MSNDQPQDPSLGTLLELSHELARSGIMTMLPGQIVDYDEGAQRASVQPLIKSRIDQEDDTVNVVSTPIVHDCPVMFLGPARGRITWPVATGDTCALWFACRSTVRWRNNGGEVDPGDDRTHDLTDAICIVGLHDFAHVPTDAPTDAIVTHGLTRIGGSDANQAIVGQSALDTFVAALVAAIAACLAEGTPNTFGADALTQLKNALGAWAAGTTLGKVK